LFCVVWLCILSEAVKQGNRESISPIQHKKIPVQLGANYRYLDEKAQHRIRWLALRAEPEFTCPGEDPAKWLLLPPCDEDLSQGTPESKKLPRGRAIEYSYSGSAVATKKSL
jgi:hypothetical protein